MMNNQSAFIDDKKMNWAFLAHLGYSMWADPVRDKRGIPCIPWELTEVNAEDHLRFDLDLWHETTKALAAAGCNMIVLDIGEGMQYESHPEIVTKGAWSKDVLREEIFNLKMLGIEAIPKLNFSACHDEWMGETARMVSTTPYYRFCEDVITEVCEVFDHPRLFHLGMDEETAGHQSCYNVCIIRQGEQWWYDLRYLAGTVMRLGARPWIWSDYIWNHEEEFLRKMSRDIVQSNWYYGDFPANDSDDQLYIRAFETLDRHGFDQVPTGSVWTRHDNFEKMVGATKSVISEEHLMGYMQSVWRPMMPLHKAQQNAGVKTLGDAKKRFES